MTPKQIACVITEDIRPGSPGVIREANEAIIKALSDYFSEGEIEIIDLDYEVHGGHHPATFDSPEEFPEVDVTDFKLKRIDEINLSFLKDYFNTDEKTAFDILQQNIPFTFPFNAFYEIEDDNTIKVSGNLTIKSIQPPTQIQAKESYRKNEQDWTSKIEVVVDKKNWEWDYA